jgi:predicted adenylyl cyclase CyaB
MMSIKNFEFKVRVNNQSVLEEKFRTLHPEYIGEDHQVDTYFNTSKGRVKLREGTIENSLIYYDRKNIAGSKESDVLLYRHKQDKDLKAILSDVLGVMVVVDKIRRIYFIENVKFHFDHVENLGEFIEVEAIDETGEIGIEKLKSQCEYYADFFELEQEDFIAESYSDLILTKTQL